MSRQAQQEGGCSRREGNAERQGENLAGWRGNGCHLHSVTGWQEHDSLLGHVDMRLAKNKIPALGGAGARPPPSDICQMGLIQEM